MQLPSMLSLMANDEADDPMLGKEMHKARLVRRISWMACLWLIGWLGISAEQTAAWTVSWQGFVNGAAIGVFLSPFLLVALIPLGLVGWAIGSLKRLRPFRWWISLILPITISASMVIPRIMDRVCPARRFERFTKVRFPRHVTNLQTFASGGLLADITDTYTFECTTEETDRLIKEFGLEKESILHPSIRSRPGSGFSPASSGWSNPERWKTRNSPGTTDFFELLTDETHTRVHVIYGTI
jgi:hypothetical protein